MCAIHAFELASNIFAPFSYCTKYVRIHSTNIYLKKVFSPIRAVAGQRSSTAGQILHHLRVCNEMLLPRQ